MGPLRWRCREQQPPPSPPPRSVGLCGGGGGIASVPVRSSIPSDSPKFDSPPRPCNSRVASAREWPPPPACGEGTTREGRKWGAAAALAPASGARWTLRGQQLESIPIDLLGTNGRQQLWIWPPLGCSGSGSVSAPATGAAETRRAAAERKRELGQRANHWNVAPAG